MPLSALAAEAPTAVRWTAAIAASLALHTGAAVVVAQMPVGSTEGQGTLASQPLQARIVQSPRPAPDPRAQTSTPPSLAESAPARRANTAARQQDVVPPRGLREGPIYYLPSELDRRPRLRSRVEPDYPRIAPPEGGYVLLRVLISEQGTVEDARVVGASPEGMFENAAVEAFGRAQFSPGTLRGVAVKSQILIEMKFHPLTPEDGAVASGGH